MQNAPHRKSVRRPLTAARIGMFASVSLIVAWTFVERGGAPVRPPESTLLEFLMAFIVIFGALLLTAMIVGLIPIRGPRVRGR